MNVYLYNKDAIGMQILTFFILTEFESSSGLLLFALFFENEKGRQKGKNNLYPNLLKWYSFSHIFKIN